MPHLTPKSSPKARKLAGKGNATLPQLHDGEGGLPAPLPLYKCRLATVRQVRLELARLYRGLMGGQIPPELAGRGGFLLATLGRLIEVGEIEKRVEQLETQANALSNEKAKHPRTAA